MQSVNLLALQAKQPQISSLNSFINYSSTISKDKLYLSPTAVAFGKLKPSFDIPQILLDGQYQYYSAPILTKDDRYGLGEDVRQAQDIAKDTLEKHYKLPSNPHGGLNGDLEASLRKAYNDSNGSPLSESQAQQGYTPLVTAIQKLGESGVLGVNIHPRVATERPDIYEQFMLLGPVGNAAVASTIAQHGDMSLATTSLASVGLAADPIGELASNDFHWEAYREIKSGEALGAYALTEPQEPGSNPAGITATAIEDDDGNIHFESGQKMWITNGNIAKYILITARIKREGKVLEDSKGRPVLNAYLVSRDELLAGATNSVGHKLSIEKSDTANVFLANIKSFNKDKHQLGPDGAGTTIYRDILSDGRVNVAMATAAKAQAAIRLSINYSKDRAFFPQVRDMLANGLAMTEAAQLLALHAARLKERVEALKHEGNKD